MCVSKNCGAERPEALKSTNLRKHVATSSQLLNLENNELDVLAKFMGHDIRTHAEPFPVHTFCLTRKAA